MRVRDLVFRGSNTICYLEAPHTTDELIVVELSANTTFMPQAGETVDISWDVQDTLLFSVQHLARRP